MSENTKPVKTVDLPFYLPTDKVVEVCVEPKVRSPELPKSIWMWSCDPNAKTKHPMDRCGGPYGISDIVNVVLNESPGSCEQCWLMCLADCAFPIYDLVFADTESEAMELYADFCADHRNALIPESDYEDYDVEGDSPTCNFTSDGRPVDTDTMVITPMRLVSVRWDFT